MLMLLGRDGVMTENLADAGTDPRRAGLLPCAGAAVRRLNESGHRVVVVLERRHPVLAGAPPTLWREIEDRLRAALRAYRVAREDAVVVSDSLPLIAAAADAGCRRALVRTGAGACLQARGLPAHVLPVAVHDDLGAAVGALVGPPP